MIEKQKTTLSERVYPWLLVIAPIVSQYRVGPIDFDVILFGVFFLCTIAFGKKLYIGKINRFMFLVIGYIILTTTINLLFGYQYSQPADIILRAGRYCLYLFITFFLGNERISYQSLMRAYRFIAYAATFYVVLQAIAFYAAGITLPSRIGGSTTTEAVDDIGRLRSFYTEPAVMGYSLVPFIVCSLFGENYRKNVKSSALDALVVSVGIVLSTSGQGILAIGVAWALWLLVSIRKGTINTKELLLVLLVVAAVFVLYESGVLKFALDRAGNTDESGAINTRMSGYKTLKLLSPLRLLFGTGFGNYIVENAYQLDVFYENINYSSLAEFLFTLGIVGTLLWVGLFIWLFGKVNACGKALLITMAVLSWSGCPMSGLFFPLWLTLICLQLPPGLFSKRSLAKASQT